MVHRSLARGQPPQRRGWAPLVAMLMGRRGHYSTGSTVRRGVLPGRASCVLKSSNHGACRHHDLHNENNCQQARLPAVHATRQDLHRPWRWMYLTTTPGIRYSTLIPLRRNMRTLVDLLTNEAHRVASVSAGRSARATGATRVRLVQLTRRRSGRAGRPCRCCGGTRLMVIVSEQARRRRLTDPTRTLLAQ